MAQEPSAERGVHNPRVVDLIRHDKDSDEVVLLMLEERPWSGEEVQLRQLEDKFNSYLGYVLDGHMVKQYPQYAGKAVRFTLDCSEPPTDHEQPFLAAMRNYAASQEIRFEVNVIEKGVSTIAPCDPA